MIMGRALGEARLRERELRAQVQNAIIFEVNCLPALRAAQRRGRPKRRGGG